MEKNDFIRLKYAAKIKENELEFDKNEDMPLVAGAGWIMKGLDNAILEMNVGDKKVVELAPEDAFGKRNDKLIKTVSTTEFKKHGQTPHPGMIVNADNMAGRVLSVTGGRVKVDFNHPLSGKTLIFDLEITKKIESKKDKIVALLEWFIKPKSEAEKVLLEKVEIKESKHELEIHVPSMLPLNSLYKKKIADDIMELIGFEKVKYLEVYEKVVKKEEPKEEVEEFVEQTAPAENGKDVTGEEQPENN